MSDSSKCNRCGQPIWWEKSKEGKSYPVNSAGNRRDFHKCTGQPASAAPVNRQSTSDFPVRTQPAPAEPTGFVCLNPQTGIEKRIALLELAVVQLQTLHGRKAPAQHGSAVTPENPISDLDIPF